MEFVFWQNILSIHQMPFLIALSENHSVTLVVEREMREERRLSGWVIPNTGKINVIVAPDIEFIKRIVEKYSNAIHVLSGINSIPIVKIVMRFLIIKKSYIIVQSEPYDFSGIKGVLRYFISKFNRIRLDKYIDVLLPTGALGVLQFNKVGYDIDKIFEWGYFTSPPSFKFIEKKVSHSKPKLLFVGSISKRKNVIYLVKEFHKVKEHFEILSIVGTGSLEKGLRKEINSSEKISYIGGLSNKEVSMLMQEYDVLVLPSLFDGWGAVVNEALQSGMRVVCSDNCGANTLLQENERGTIFSLKDKNSLTCSLLIEARKGVYCYERRSNIIKWSKNAISPQAVTDYFISICDYIYNNADKRPLPPWRRK